jgi:hypothetical protein
MMARKPERGGIVIGWLLKLVVSIAIVGLVAFEAGAVVVAHVTAESAATEVSNEAAFVVGRGGRVPDAEDAAKTEAAKQGVALIAFSVSADREIVSVRVEKKAKTLILHRLSWTKSWTVVRTERGRTAGP